MKNHIIKDNRGVSLVELIASIAIFGIVAAAAITMLVFASKANSDISVDTVENTRIVSSFEFIKKQIRQNNEVKVSIKADGSLDFIKVGEGEYALIDGKWTYSSDEGEVVLFQGVDTVTVSAEDLVANSENTVEWLSITFILESGKQKQLTVSCRE
jgi:prepilin-type N-terminal cleavage/methylation domain-containing protein